ncbi:MAG TPA: F0F1 ATP synthase subunit delta [Gaiellaceae bacterium]|nr:F0F1 ATP synthase subunit delta [Gaiellaceae bacterium]
MSAAHRIYARALFEAAQDKGKLQRVRNEVDDLADALVAVPELAGVLANPEIDESEKAEVLAAVLVDSDPVTRNFLRLLAEEGRTTELDQIVREFDLLVAAEEHLLSVELTTALELSDDDFASLVAQIEQASGRPVQATRSVDPDLIGGVVVQAGSLRLDASVRGRLERLRHELATARS